MHVTADWSACLPACLFTLFRTQALSIIFRCSHSHPCCVRTVCARVHVPCGSQPYGYIHTQNLSMCIGTITNPNRIKTTADATAAFHWKERLYKHFVPNVGYSFLKCNPLNSNHLFNFNFTSQSKRKIKESNFKLANSIFCERFIVKVIVNCQWIKKIVLKRD